MPNPLRFSTRAAGVVVAVHALLALLHGVTHVGQGVFLPAWANAYVAVVIFTGPIAAWFVIRSKPATGAVLLALTMAGAFVFGFAHHFVIPGPDHVAHLAHGAWRASFRATAAFLAASEALGTWIALSLLASQRRER